MKLKKSNFELSLVIPLFNEEQMVGFLCLELIKFKKEFPKNTEIIFIDDGSNDSTFQLLKNNEIKNYYSVRVIQLSRNFGHQSAIMAGLEHASGKIVVSLDGDLQHPLKVIPKMLDFHVQGINIVQTRRIDSKKTPLIKQASANFFYFIFEQLSQVKISTNTSDFRSMDRAALTALLSLPEKRKFIRGMVNWIGFSSITIPYSVNLRVAGTTKYSMRKMLNLTLHAITSFSAVPLYVSAYISFIFLIFFSIYASYVFYVKFFLHTAIAGWSSVMLILLFLSCSIFLVLALFGVYLSAIYDEVKNRPLYVIKSKQ